MSKSNGTSLLETAEEAPKQEVALIAIDRIAAETLRVPIVGTAPLITHRFSEKAKRQMLDNMQGRKNPKVAKDPQAEYLAATEEVLADPLMTQIVLADMRREWMSLKAKYDSFTEFRELVLGDLEAAI